MSYCRNCGSEIGATDDYCVECGAALETPDPEGVSGDRMAGNAGVGADARAETVGDGGTAEAPAEPPGSGAADRTATDRAATEPETGTGLESNVAGALAYVMGLLTGVLFFVLEPDDEFVRFHAAQSIVVSLAMFALSIALVVVQTALSFVPGVGGLLALLFGLVWVAFWLAGLALWGLLMFRAYQGDRWRVPVLGGVAENLAS